MRPCIGCASAIIQSAMDLGILCRPVELGWTGTALRPEKDSFERVDAASNNYGGLYHPTPGQLCLDWMLTTRELIEAELAESYKMGF